MGIGLFTAVRAGEVSMGSLPLLSGGGHNLAVGQQGWPSWEEPRRETGQSKTNQTCKNQAEPVKTDWSLCRWSLPCRAWATYGRSLFSLSCTWTWSGAQRSCGSCGPSRCPTQRRRPARQRPRADAVAASVPLPRARASRMLLHCPLSSQAQVFPQPPFTWNHTGREFWETQLQLS